MKTIRAFLAERLLHTQIFEQAVTLKNFTDKCTSLYSPIVSHFFKIIYGQHIRHGLPSMKHYKQELFAFCEQLSDMELKTGNKYKRMHTIFIQWYELDTVRVWLKISKKTYAANISVVIDNALINELYTKFCGLLDAIAKEDDRQLETYIKNL